MENELKQYFESYFKVGDEYLQECDLCHDHFSIREINLTEKNQFICNGCIVQ